MTARLKTALATNLATNLANNTSGAITPTVMRTHLTDMIDSALPADVVLYTGADFMPASGRRFPGRSHVHQTVVAGGTAGNLTVTGIKTIDILTSVIRLDRDATAANINISDLTAEFTISADDTINNTSGTNTTGDSLLVTWQSGAWDGYDQVGMAFPDAQDTHAALFLAAPSHWPSVTINVIGIASSFGSGNVRMYRSGDTGTTQTIAVAASFSGAVWSNVGNGAGVFTDVVGLGIKILQCPFTRLGTDGADTLAEDFCIIAVYLTPGT